jgi:pSer/pThr/pTyr-binding forkhead associated (FHA) protein
VAAPQAAPVAAQPRLLVEGTTMAFDLAGKPSVVVGREDIPSNSFPDIDLTPYGAEEGGVSRLHARIAQSGDTWTIEDLESTNFTFVNHKRIAPKTPISLNDGDEIRLGRVGLRFKTTA